MPLLRIFIHSHKIRTLTSHNYCVFCSSWCCLWRDTHCMLWGYSLVRRCTMNLFWVSISTVSIPRQSWGLWLSLLWKPWNMLRGGNVSSNSLAPPCFFVSKIYDTYNQGWILSVPCWIHPFRYLIHEFDYTLAALSLFIATGTFNFQVSIQLSQSKTVLGIMHDLSPVWKPWTLLRGGNVSPNPLALDSWYELLGCVSSISRPFTCFYVFSMSLDVHVSSFWSQWWKVKAYRNPLRQTHLPGQS